MIKRDKYISWLIVGLAFTTALLFFYVANRQKLHSNEILNQFKEIDKSLNKENKGIGPEGIGAIASDSPAFLPSKTIRK